MDFIGLKRCFYAFECAECNDISAVGYFAFGFCIFNFMLENINDFLDGDEFTIVTIAIQTDDTISIEEIVGVMAIGVLEFAYTWALLCR